jgi:Domain of unknown function (DUF4164)
LAANLVSSKQAGVVRACDNTGAPAVNAPADATFANSAAAETRPTRFPPMAVDAEPALTAETCSGFLAQHVKPMSLPGAIDAALKRLTSALDRLEAATERRMQADAGRADAEEEFAIMRDDRSRLAVELDGALARVSRLERANDEAMRRIDRAAAAVRNAMGDDAPAESGGSDVAVAPGSMEE